MGDDLMREVDFYALVYQATGAIPRGMVSTYGDIARALGDVRAARAVGRALNLNPRPIEVPCHRVVASDGSLGGFGQGIERKIELLKAEGINIENGIVRNFRELRFREFNVEPVLRTLREEQESLASRVVLDGDVQDARYLLACDAHYPTKGIEASRTKGSVREKVVGGIILYDRTKGEVVQRYVVTGKTAIPYIPTYLSYRELPVLLPQLKEILWEHDNDNLVLVMDGNGVLHPRRTGIATHAGVLLEVPTVGVAKSLLTGTYDGAELRTEGHTPVIYNGTHVGYAVRANNTIKRPVFVSPGHMVGVDGALHALKGCFIHRIPEPLRQAHILAKDAASRIYH